MDSIIIESIFVLFLAANAGHDFIDNLKIWMLFKKLEQPHISLYPEMSSRKKAQQLFKLQRKIHCDTKEYEETFQLRFTHFIVNDSLCQIIIERGNEVFDHFMPRIVLFTNIHALIFSCWDVHIKLISRHR